MTQRAWETAMGMHGYSGSALEKQDRREPYFVRRTTPLASPKDPNDPCGVYVYTYSTELRRHIITGVMHERTARAIYGNDLKEKPTAS